MLREAQLVGVGLMTVVIHACFLSVCVAKHHKYQICSPSSCGDMRNISYPFRLQDDPPSCGYPEYELICENNRTMINLHGGKYLVTQINYQNYTIRVVDPGRKKDNCLISSPLHSIGSSSSSPTYAYAVVGEYVSVGDIPYSCTIGTSIIIQPLKSLPEPSNLSMSDLQDYMLLGLQLSFLPLFCERQCEMKGQVCSTISTDSTGNVALDATDQGTNISRTLQRKIKSSILIPNFLITNDLFLPFIRGLLYPKTLKFRGKDFKKNLVIAILLSLLQPLHDWRLDTAYYWLYSELQIDFALFDCTKQNQFRCQGGFGSVYKGKLRSGRIVAVKVLVMSKANGQDFINEVATIGRIHHVNVVKLVGFCVQGSKWALIYDFMPNGSLDKFIFLKEENNTFLSWERLYKVALGVGRGIQYLHQDGGEKKECECKCSALESNIFSSWIYDRYDQGDNIDLGDTTEDEKKLVRKMVIVALWCIQMKPIDRPSMSKALEMLEGEVELLEMPPKPTLYSEEMLVEDYMSNPIEAPISLCNSMGTITLDGR
ncbi:Leaf rust 10 disease resistance locus receptor-like protein kinase-like 2.4 [Vitis vinifera]|uniref:Leaf rust 10 disease resistance locus receptor-like protein kinase-like 2.4 n=1 Tax=Vitis vinifera TaxID=29760 RepID=A0A438HSR5_VITVI|nr:Leaf rust 10 disease resistance locus receptor-like protein kinase-like 2.4 [Vitis vinifera]